MPPLPVFVNVEVELISGFRAADVYHIKRVFQKFGFDVCDRGWRIIGTLRESELQDMLDEIGLDLEGEISVRVLQRMSGKADGKTP